MKRLGAVRVAAVMHKRPYEKLEETYRALILWVEENGYETSGPPEELYLNDPAKVPTDELLTEIRFPVSRK
jgi:AraC family transcriptional regulator